MLSECHGFNGHISGQLDPAGDAAERAVSATAFLPCSPLSVGKTDFGTALSESKPSLSETTMLKLRTWRWAD